MAFNHRDLVGIYSDFAKPEIPVILVIAKKGAP
jgi:hypothetical protein